MPGRDADQIVGPTCSLRRGTTPTERWSFTARQSRYVKAEGWSSQIHPLDTERILRVLQAHRVKYTLIGGIAAILHQWSGSTADVDIVPEASTAALPRVRYLCGAYLARRAMSLRAAMSMWSWGRPAAAFMRIRSSIAAMTMGTPSSSTSIASRRRRGYGTPPGTSLK